MLYWFYNHIYNFTCGVLLAVLGYFTEIQGAVHVMWAVLALDLISGVLASILKRKEKFSMKKFTIAICRAIAVTLFVALLYAMDKEMNQNVAASYFIAAYLISGFYLWSAGENLETLFGGRIFGIMKGFISKRVQETSGVDITEKEVPNGKL